MSDQQPEHVDRYGGRCLYPPEHIGNVAIRLVCLHCGASQGHIIAPVPVSALRKSQAEFIEAHRQCPEPVFNELTRRYEAPPR